MPASTGWYPGATPKPSCTRHFGPPPKRSREHAEGQVLTWIWNEHKKAVEAAGDTLVDMPKFDQGWNMHGNKLWAGITKRRKGTQGEAGLEASGPVPDGVSAKALGHARLLVVRQAQLDGDGHAGPSRPAEGDAFDDIFGAMDTTEPEAASQARHSSVAAPLSCSCCVLQASQAMDLDSESQPPSGSVPADSAAPGVPGQAPKKRARKAVTEHEGHEPVPKRKPGRPRKDPGAG